jgi:excisionase family DNA binding protein
VQLTLTTKQLADAIGVSESSVKRWVDDGRIRANRTAGGHRRIAVQDAARYVRDHAVTVVRPEQLGLSDLVSYGRLGAETGDVLYQFLTAGATAEASGMLQSQLLAGESVAAIIDGPLVQAMTRVGELWLEGRRGILTGHRATEVAVQAVIRLRALLAPPPGGPAAIGGAPSGDPYMLPSLAAAAVLEDEGLSATNLGPDTPMETLTLGIEALAPRLVWLSVSVAPDPARLRREVVALAGRAREIGAVVVIGGTQAGRLRLPRIDGVHVGGSMAELRALVRGLRNAA